MVVVADGQPVLVTGLGARDPPHRPLKQRNRVGEDVESSMPASSIAEGSTELVQYSGKQNQGRRRRMIVGRGSKDTHAVMGREVGEGPGERVEEVNGLGGPVAEDADVVGGAQLVVSGVLE